MQPTAPAVVMQETCNRITDLTLSLTVNQNYKHKDKLIGRGCLEKTNKIKNKKTDKKTKKQTNKKLKQEGLLAF